jgi:hypothetical protein
MYVAIVPLPGYLATRQKESPCSVLCLSLISEHQLRIVIHSINDDDQLTGGFPTM